MIQALELERVRTASRRAAILSFVGLLSVIGALVYSALQLRNLETRRSQLTLDLQKLNAQKEQAQRDAQGAVEILNEKNSGPLVEVVRPQARATPLKTSNGSPVNASNGLPEYDFILSLSVPEARKPDIRQVQYTFNHPSFLNQTKASNDPISGFAVSYRGWGCLNLVTITLILKDGKTVPLYFDECKSLKSLGWS